MRSSIVSVALSAGVLVASSAWADPAPSASPAAPTSPAQPSAAEAPAPAPSPAEPEDERTAENALYLEGLGPGLFYSINYDRSFGDFAARIGFGYLSLSTSAVGTDSMGNAAVQETASASFFSVPITVSYLGVGTKKSMLELGLGATIWHFGAGIDTIDAKSTSSSENASETLVLPVAIVGYRYQPPHGGFVFRGGFSPIFAGSSIPILPWPYVGLGGAF
jgi:hypothetical protein